MEQLNIDQVHKRLLNIATIVNGVCEKHNIPMYMISGTMLGAVRHKGFIPWDDDMDFAIPYEHYNSLIGFLKNELPANLSCLTYENSRTYIVPWIKVEDRETKVIDNSLSISIDDMPGITIDIFPLVSCEKGSSAKITQRIQKWIRIDRFVYSRVHNRKLGGVINCVKTVTKTVFPFSSKRICNRIMLLTDSLNSGGYYTIPMDPNYYNRYFPKQWFEPLTKYNFEDTCFYGVAQYDSYLKMIYNNYLELPPENKRRTHVLNSFFK